MRTSQPRHPAARQLQHELEVVESAITMVASGGASRVRLGGLAFGEQLLERADRTARHAGVLVTPIWPTGDGGIVDMDVERASDVGA